MLSRGTVAKNGHVMDEEYKIVKTIGNASVLAGKHHEHSLPDYSHSPNRIYIKENSDGSFRELRVYDKYGKAFLEIGYHGEQNLTGNRNKKILHYHYFDENLKHLSAKKIEQVIYNEYKMILEVYGL